MAINPAGIPGPMKMGSPPPSKEQILKFGQHINEKNPTGGTFKDIFKHLDHHSDPNDPTFDPVKAASARYVLQNFDGIDTNKDKKVTGTEITKFAQKLPPGPPVTFPAVKK